MSKIVLITLYEVEYLGTRFLASYLKDHGHDVHIIHFKDFIGKIIKTPLEKHHGHQLIELGNLYIYGTDAYPYTQEELDLLCEAIRNEQPNIIGISSRSAYDHVVTDFVQCCKKACPTALLVAGGYGATLNTAFYLKTGFDAVIRGDGEEALLELTEAFEKKQDWHVIKNLSYLHEDSLIENPMRQQCKDLDFYSFPLYGHEYCSYIDNNTYQRKHDQLYELRIYSTLLGRGCVGKCSYCSGGQWYEQYKKDHKTVYRRRTRSLENIFGELNSLDKSHWDYIHFWDEMFVAPVEKLKEFFIRYKQEIHIPFFMHVSYDLLIKHPELVELAVDAGWYYTGIGIQTGSKTISKIYNRHNTNEQYIQYVKDIHNKNFKYHIHIIGGNCYEDEKNFEETLQLIKQLPFNYNTPNCNFLMFMRLNILPKTPITVLAPKVITDPMPASLFTYRAALCQLVQIMNEKDFTEIRKIEFYRKNPELLLELYKSLLVKQQYTYFKNLVQKNKDKPIIFYGAGDLYQRNKHFFKDCNPIAMLLDSEYLNPEITEIDGIPIMPVQKITELHDSCPIVCFFKYAPLLQRKLERDHHIAKERIHATSIIIPHWE